MTRFHKAARDGILDILKEATESQLNTADEDGMTPTLWAAYEGNLDALRLIVGRGGKVDKSDYFGNTALHFAAARGHMHCVTFLANFGANLWAMDIDFHTPKELAAMNNRDEILRFLDGIAAKEQATNWKDAQRKQQKAQKNAEKLSKEFEKMQEETKKMAEAEQKRLEKEKEKMKKSGSNNPNIMPHRPSTMLTILKGMGKKNPSKGTVSARSSASSDVNSPYSSIVGSPATTTGIYTKNTGITNIARFKKKLPGTVNSQTRSDDFKVGEVEPDGKRSVRSIDGLRRDSQVIFTGSFDTQGGKERGKITNVFDTQGELRHATSVPELLHNSDSGFGDEILLQEPASIFDRPGFGSVAFRSSISANLNALSRADRDDKDSAVASERSDARLGGIGSGTEDCSIGSAGSLAHRQNNLPWDDDDVASDDDPEETRTEWSSLQTFLASAGVAEYLSLFMKEEIDLDALMLMKKSDFEALHLKMGPIMKLTNAIERRKNAMEDPGEFADSKL